MMANTDGVDPHEWVKIIKSYNLFAPTFESTALPPDWHGLPPDWHGSQ